MTNERYETINKYIIEDWDLHIILDPKFFEDKFDLSNRDARYYLQKFVDKGILCRIKIEKNVYYCKGDWFPILRKYNALDDIKVS